MKPENQQFRTKEAILFSKSLKSWAVAMELLNCFREHNLQLIDASNLGAPYFVSIQRKKFQLNTLKNNARVSSVKYYKLPKRVVINKSIRILYTYIKGYKDNNFPYILVGKYDLTRIVHCRLSARLGSQVFQFRQVKFRDFYRFSSIATKALQLARTSLHPELNRIYIYNGRDVIEAIFVKVAKDMGIGVTFLERGSKSNSWQTFQQSPHFHPEWWELITEFSSKEATSRELNRKKRDEFANAKLSGIDIYMGEVWNQGYEEIDKGLAGTFALFLSTSTMEFSPFEEFNFNPSEFADQFEAVLCLARVLRQNGVRLVVRRHPNSVGADWKDREAPYWQRVIQEPNVVYFGPNEKISSYSLLEKAERVYVWKSSMGYESLLLGKPTFTLCSAKWSWSEEFWALNERQIKDSLTKSQNQKIVENVLIAYGDFMGNSGEESQLFQSINKNYLTLRTGETIPNLALQKFRSKTEELWYKYLIRKPKRNS
jgi:hypothetical protein